MNRVLGSLYAFPSGLSRGSSRGGTWTTMPSSATPSTNPKRHHLSPSERAPVCLKALYPTPALFFIYFRAAARETATYPAELRARIRRERLVTIGGQLAILGALIALAGPWLAFKVYMVPYFLVFPVAFVLNRLGSTTTSIPPIPPAGAR